MNHLFEDFRKRVDTFLKEYLSGLNLGSAPELERLRKAVEYSTLSGGKRFRPVLAMLTARALGQSEERVVPFGASVEIIHSYSLIHDDLPSMDNDDFRRGKPSCHKAFGEGMALLAGDGLQSLAFQILAEYYKDQPELGLELVWLLSHASGMSGMVGGQVLDTQKDKRTWSTADLTSLHQMKTGALIRVCVLGAGKICGASVQQTADLTRYIEKIGVAFQVADDLEDSKTSGHREGEPNMVRLLGPQQAKEFCNRLIAEALECLTAFSEDADGLREIALLLGQPQTTSALPKQRTAEVSL